MRTARRGANSQREVAGLPYRRLSASRSQYRRACAVSLIEWSSVGPVKLTQVGADVEVTAAMERIIARNITVDVLKAAITGVSTG